MTTGGEKALVTGGDGALGSDVARALREAGFEFHVTALSADMAASFAEKPDNRGLAVHIADLFDFDDTKRLMDEVGAPLGALVTTLGGFLGGPLAALTEADVDQVIARSRRVELVPSCGTSSRTGRRLGGVRARQPCRRRSRY